MFEYSRSRSRVAKWIFENREKIHPFRMRDVCNFSGAPAADTDESDDYLQPIEKRLSPAVAHRVISDLVDKELLEPTISSTKVEVLVPLIAGREKRWKKLIGPKGTIRFAFTMVRRWLQSRMWSVMLWVVTVVAAAWVRDQFF